MQPYASKSLSGLLPAERRLTLFMDKLRRNPLCNVHSAAIRFATCITMSRLMGDLIATATVTRLI